MESYTLVSRDNHTISFTRNELEHVEYAKNIFTDLSDNWIHTAEHLDVPLVNHQGLQVIKEFLRVRVEVGKPPQIRDRGMEIIDADIFDNHRKNIGIRLLRIPPLISVDSMKSWTSAETGLDERYIVFLETYISREQLFQYMRNADFMGCTDLIYLLQARCAFLLVHDIENYIQKYMNEAYIIPHGQKVEAFMKWSENPENSSEHLFMQEFNEAKATHSHLVKGIVLRFIRHRSIDLPQENWDDERWEQFKRELPLFYSKLKLTDRQKELLFINR